MVRDWCPPGRAPSCAARFPVTLAKYADEIDFVVRALGTKEVVELDTLATALYVTRENGSPGDVEGRARRLVELKPHVSFQQALDAVREADRIAREAESLATVGVADQSG